MEEVKRLEVTFPSVHFGPVARVAELADAPDLGSGPARVGGSSPLSRTIPSAAIQKEKIQRRAKSPIPERHYKNNRSGRVMRARSPGFLREERVDPSVPRYDPIRVTQCINNGTVAPLAHNEFFRLLYRAERAANLLALNNNNRMRSVNHLLMKHACKHTRIPVSKTHSQF